MKKIVLTVCTLFAILLVSTAQDAQILFDQQKYQESLDAANSSIKKNPAVGEAYFWAGLSAAALERFSEAAGYYAKVIALEPDHFDAHDRLGRLYLFNFNETEKALPYLRRCTELAKNEYNLYHLGIAYSRLSQFDAALTAFSESRKIMLDAKSEDAWLTDNLEWAIGATKNKEPLFF